MSLPPDTAGLRIPVRALVPAIALAAALATAGARADAGDASPRSAARQTGVTPVTRAAVDAGVLACAGRINQVSRFLVAGAPHGALLFVPPARPDRQLVSTSLEIGGDGPLVYASGSFAPGQANGCGGVYETVAWWDAACEAVRQSRFAEAEAAGVLSERIAVLQAGATLRIFLMPAGDGCLSIKKEIVP